MIPAPMLAKLRELATKTCAFYWSDVHEPEEHKAAFETAMGMAQEAWMMREGEIAELKKLLNTAVCLFDSKLGEEDRFTREASKLLNPKERP